MVFPSGPRPWIFSARSRRVHIARFSADEGFVYFDLARQFVMRVILTRKADALKHKPCRFLSHAKPTSEDPS
jgi:hypothetical protein